MGGTGATGLALNASSSSEVSMSEFSVRRSSRDRRLAYLRLTVATVLFFIYSGGTLLSPLYRTVLDEPSIRNRLSSC